MVLHFFFNIPRCIRTFCDCEGATYSYYRKVREMASRAGNTLRAPPHTDLRFVFLSLCSGIVLDLETDYIDTVNHRHDDVLLLPIGEKWSQNILFII